MKKILLILFCIVSLSTFGQHCGKITVKIKTTDSVSYDIGVEYWIDMRITSETNRDITESVQRIMGQQDSYTIKTSHKWLVILKEVYADIERKEYCIEKLILRY